MTTELKPCPCGKVPTELGIDGTADADIFVHGTCCFTWGVPVEEGQTLTEAWNAAPRGERVCEWDVIADPYATHKTSCGMYYARRMIEALKFCEYCGGKIQVKEQSNV